MKMTVLILLFWQIFTDPPIFLKKYARVYDYNHQFLLYNLKHENVSVNHLVYFLPNMDVAIVNTFVTSTINSLPFTHRPTLNDCGGNRITQASLVSRSGNVLLTDQASLLDGLSLAAFAFDQDGLATAEGDIGEGSAGDAAVAPPGLVDDEALDRRCRIAGPVVGLEHAPSATGCSSVPSAAACPQAPPPCCSAKRRLPRFTRIRKTLRAQENQT